MYIYRFFKNRPNPFPEIFISYKHLHDDARESFAPVSGDFFRAKTNPFVTIRFSIFYSRTCLPTSIFSFPKKKKNNNVHHKTEFGPDFEKLWNVRKRDGKRTRRFAPVRNGLRQHKHTHENVSVTETVEECRQTATRDMDVP